MDRNLERWLDRKKLWDHDVAIKATDPYVDENFDILDLNYVDDDVMDETIEFMFRVSESGVDET